ncbi:uncharacterized protein TrAtP1_011074 [Trichoderma atroviride]|uniref:uncharacterized protein n=1 Tax=Hypocrea atroviridis TaxID=63577 RepID=UPI00332E03C0|nr:hypothetical protein TrAtP1_011074 [Trichoderma atroviride]
MHLTKAGWLSVLLAVRRDKLGVVSRAPELWAQIASAGWDCTANRWNDCRLRTLLPHMHSVRMPAFREILPIDLPN